MVDTSDAELQAVRSRTQNIIESIVGKLFVTRKHMYPHNTMLQMI